MSMENIAGARKPAKREDEHTVAGEHRMMRGDATASQAFMAHPTYGDGGMAAAVRLRS